MTPQARVRGGVRSLGPLWLALAAYAAAIAWIGWTAWSRTEGHFVYAQDDPYIHLTLARTLASAGVWGLAAGEPAAASSAPLWTAALALFGRLGALNVWLPFLINLVAGAALIVLVHRQIQHRLPEGPRAAALIAFCFVLPLPTLVFVGMEHTAHVLCVVALCGAAASRLADDASSDGIWPAGAALAALAAGLRYEGLFVVAAVAGLAWLRGRRVWTVPNLLIAMFLAVETLHVCLVNLEWFYRYEAYAVALGILAVVVAVADLRQSGRLGALRAGSTGAQRAAVIIALVVLCLPLFTRGAFALMTTATACNEIYRQQYQLGRFFGAHYRGDAIALNDIGAVSWMAPVDVVDLIGLASNDIAQARRAGRVDAAFIADVVERRGVAAVAIYESHFRAVGELPPGWMKAGEWQMPSAIAVSGDTVAFFASSRDRASRLRIALEEFKGELPDGVRYLPSRRAGD